MSEDLKWGWFKAHRTDAARELLERYPKAFLLLYQIASRARYSHEADPDGREFGQAEIGDYENCGLTEKEYRTAKVKLEKGGFAAFKGANKGTIATLLRSDVFDIRGDTRGEQKGEQRANRGRTEGD